MSHSLSPSSLICPSTKKAFINCTYRCQTITIILYQLACTQDCAFLLAGLDFRQLERQWTFPCRSTALSYQNNTLNSALMTWCLQPETLNMEFCANAMSQRYYFLLKCWFYPLLVCLCSFLLQQPVPSPPAPSWSHGYAPLQEHPEWSVWNNEGEKLKVTARSW